MTVSFLNMNAETYRLFLICGISAYWNKTFDLAFTKPFQRQDLGREGWGNRLNDHKVINKKLVPDSEHVLSTFYIKLINMIIRNCPSVQEWYQEAIKNQGGSIIP